jgi:hypothetical protein
VADVVSNGAFDGDDCCGFDFAGNRGVPDISPVSLFAAGGAAIAGSVKRAERMN